MDSVVSDGSTYDCHFVEMPLMRGTIDHGFELTGPIARGDWATVEAHKRAIRVEHPELENLYETLAEATVLLA